MKRIYKQFSYGKELVGYDYKGYYIEIENEQRPYSMFGIKKWYCITLKNGKKCCSDLLKEVKEMIDKESE